jgi:hypothetical protein
MRLIQIQNRGFIRSEKFCYIEHVISNVRSNNACNPQNSTRDVDP